MPGRAAKIIVTERQRETLETIIRARESHQGLVQRARIIVHAFQGLRNEQIAPLVGLDRHAVGVWRRRWKAAFERLIAAEFAARSCVLKRTIAGVLSDRPRPGRRSRFTPEQVALIVAVACEPPEQSSRPISHWTSRELADEVIHRKIVPAISARQIGRFFKGVETSAASSGAMA